MFADLANLFAAQGDAIAHVIVELRKQWREERNEPIAPFKAEIAELKGKLDAVAELKGKVDALFTLLSFRPPRSSPSGQPPSPLSKRWKVLALSNPNRMMPLSMHSVSHRPPSPNLMYLTRVGLMGSRSVHYAILWLP
jgi:hypothetical protein